MPELARAFMGVLYLLRGPEVPCPFAPKEASRLVQRAVQESSDAVKWHRTDRRHRTRSARDHLTVVRERHREQFLGLRDRERRRTATIRAGQLE